MLSKKKKSTGSLGITTFSMKPNLRGVENMVNCGLFHAHPMKEIEQSTCIYERPYKDFVTERISVMSISALYSRQNNIKKKWGNLAAFVVCFLYTRPSERAG